MNSQHRQNIKAKIITDISSLEKEILQLQEKSQLIIPESVYCVSCSQELS